MTRLSKKALLCSAVALFTMCFWTANAATQLNSEHHRAAEKALAKGDEDKASRELKLALQANPLDAEAHYKLGTLLARKGAEDQAMIGFQRTLKIDPIHPQALHNLGTLMLRRGEAVPAAQLLEAAVTRHPDYIPPYNSLAKAYFLAGLPEFAIATYREVLRRDSRNAVASQNLSLLLAATDKPDKKKEEPKKLPGDDSVKNLDEFLKKKETLEKIVDDKAPPMPPPSKPVPETTGPKPEALRKLLRGLPYLTVEEQDGVLAVTGWTRGPKERELLDRILAKWPKILDLTGIDAGDPQRMLEVDAVLFVVVGFDNTSIGFNFLQLISFSFDYYNKTPSDSGAWDNIPAPLNETFHWAALLAASVNYDINIANAVEERVAVLARPHLTTLSGTPAYFLAGGEWVFRVSGIETGNIKPYPFGTSISVTPTLLRTPSEDGTPRVHIDVTAQRTSVLEVLTAVASEEDIVFDKLSVSSQAVLDLNQTLILSGLNQREQRYSRSGVPILKEIPLLKYLFSQKVTVETNTAVIILLTPRDPAFNDDQNRKALKDFIKMRRAWAKAQKGTKKDMRKFQKRYPNWKNLAPNRFSSHFFLAENSEIYRRVSGEEIIDEDLDLHLLKEDGAKIKKDKDTNEKKDKDVNKEAEEKKTKP